MGNRRRLKSWLRIGAQTAFLTLAEWNYRRLTTPRAMTGENYGLVSIIVPARNEAETLPHLLHSLAVLNYGEFEIIVVNDSSTDETAAIALQAGCTVIDAGALPPGWTGKCFACSLGADAAKGEWLLFTDADTLHEPNALAAALGLAIEKDAALVSLLARQHCRTFWERAILPYAYALYFVGAIRVNRRGGPSIANGQYMLFRRSSYIAAGGHAGVRNSIVEDVALAGVVQRRGERAVLARGERLLSVRMYDDLPSLWEGFSKNAFRFLLASPITGVLTALASISIATSAPSLIRAESTLERVALVLTPSLGLAVWYRRFGVTWMYAALYPVASAIFGLIALDSIRRTIVPKATRWRGRTY